MFEGGSALTFGDELEAPMFGAAVSGVSATATPDSTNACGEEGRSRAVQDMDPLLSGGMFGNSPMGHGNGLCFNVMEVQDPHADVARVMSG